MAFPALPVRIARIDRAVAGNGDVVRLVHHVGVKPDTRLGATFRNRKNVVLLVVGDEHRAIAIEADGVADAALGERCKGFRRCTTHGQSADGAGLAEIDDEEVAVEIGGGPFDAERVFAGRRDLHTFEQFCFGCDERRRDDEQDATAQAPKIPAGCNSHRRRCTRRSDRDRPA